MPCASKARVTDPGAAAKFDRAMGVGRQFIDHRLRQFAARRHDRRGLQRIAQPLPEQRPPAGASRSSARVHASGAAGASNGGCARRVRNPAGSSSGVTSSIARRMSRHGRFVEAEAAEVVGEVQHAAARQARDRGAQQAHVFALHVEIVRARLELENVGGSQKIRSYSPAVGVAAIASRRPAPGGDGRRRCRSRCRLSAHHCR